jgi:hypothetical protein
MFTLSHTKNLFQQLSLLFKILPMALSTPKTSFGMFLRVLVGKKKVQSGRSKFQNPPDGPFNSKDLIWHVFKGVSGQKGGAIWKVQIAYMSNQWVQYSMDGREQ